MKIFKYIYLIIIIFTIGACNNSDDTNELVRLAGAPSFDQTKEYGVRMKVFYDQYGVWCQYNIPAKDINYAWTESTNWSATNRDFDYDEADVNYIVKVLDFFEKDVMSNIPSVLLKEYLGLNIAFEGRMYNAVELESNSLKYTKLSDFPNLTTSYKEPIYGWNGSRYLMLAPVGPDFDSTDKNIIRRKWTALIVGNAMKNMPNPDDFEKANTKAWSALRYVYDSYVVKGSRTDGWYYSFFFDTYQSPFADGLLSPGPIMAASMFDGYDNEEKKTGLYVGIKKYFSANTPLKAFADYVAYIMYAPAAEKKATRLLNDKIITNETLVKNYCKKYLNWDLPELGDK